MDIRFKDLSHATKRGFHTGKWDRCELLEEREQIMLRRIFNDIIEGKYDCLYKITEKSFKAYHRSPKTVGAVQLSVACFMNGVLEPQSDVQIKSPEDMVKEGVESGIWHTRKNGGYA